MDRWRITSLARYCFPYCGACASLAPHDSDVVSVTNTLRSQFFRLVAASP